MSIQMSGILGLYNEDLFLNQKIDLYLSKTKNAELNPTTFNDLLNSIFISLEKDEFIAAFKQFDKNLIENALWATASNEIVVLSEVLEFDNVGQQYYKNYVTKFVNDNKSILIKEFIIKFSKEKGIRESLVSPVLVTPALDTKNIGQTLNPILEAELSQRKADIESAQVMATINSKEFYEYQLPVLTGGKMYKVEVENAISYVDTESKLFFFPPVVEKDTKVPVTLVELNSDSLVTARNTFVFDVKPPRYHCPLFKTYNVEQGTKISITLDPVLDDYTYSVSVPEGYGTAELNTLQLSYTAPKTAFPMQVGVMLKLMYKEKVEVYSTVINFAVVMTSSEADISERESVLGRMKKDLVEQEQRIASLESSNTVTDYTELN